MAFRLWLTGEGQPITQIRWSRETMLGVTQEWNLDAIADLCQKPHRFERIIDAAGFRMERSVKKTSSASGHLACNRGFIRDPNTPEPADEE